ncbi:MAG: hypothetical protein AAFQ17_00310 [Pseudomonadota bacterium]
MRTTDFLNDETGAVTVDLVALAAGILILGVGAVSLLSNEVQSVVDEMELLYPQAATFSLPTEN